MYNDMKRILLLYLFLLPLVATFGQGNLSVEEMAEKGMRLYEEENYVEAVECFRDAAERIKKAEACEATMLRPHGGFAGQLSEEMRLGKTTWGIAIKMVKA